MTKPMLTTVPSDTPLQTIFDIINRDGGIVISNYLPTEDIDEVNKLLEDEFNTSDNAGYASTEWRRMLCGLIGRASKFGSTLLRHPLWNAIMEEFLGFETEFHSLTVPGEKKMVKTSFLLTIANGLQLGPGAIPQALHRDEVLYGIPRMEGRKPPIMGCFVAGSNVTARNGATMVIPKSHLWDQERFPKVEEAIPVEMIKGSAMFWLGSTYHGAGTNVCHPGEVDSLRRVYACFGSADNMRQEENQFLAVPLEVARTLHPDVLKRLGWLRSQGGAGQYDLKDPLHYYPGMADLHPPVKSIPTPAVTM